MIAEAIYSATAPLRFTDNQGVQIYQDFHARLDDLINPTADPEAEFRSAQIAAFDKLAARAAR